MQRLGIDPEEACSARSRKRKQRRRCNCDSQETGQEASRAVGHWRGRGGGISIQGENARMAHESDECFSELTGPQKSRGRSDNAAKSQAGTRKRAGSTDSGVEVKIERNFNFDI
jgi:hypothetical protein